ncbi:MAG: maltokinase N-terminal cap-like domain-containing protein [Acidimicrobiales bacterium]
MGVVHPGATLRPRFRDFLPRWLAHQSWYAGTNVPELSAVGFFRIEDPDGEVGMETHLVSDGALVYQIPMTYRGEPLSGPGAGAGLITTAEHSVLGTRWIYDAALDPVWIAQVARLVREEGVCEPSSKRGAAGPAEARGCRLVPPGRLDGKVTVDVVRVLSVAGAEPAPGLLGTLVGTWRPEGPDGPVTTGCLVALGG